MTDLGSYGFQSDDLATLAQKASGKKVASSDDSIDTQIKAATKNTAAAIKLRDAEVADPALKQRQADELRQADEDTKRRTSAYDSFAAASKDLENFKPPPTQKQTDPLQAFGSLGSVFGILASAFTHQPWQNAMNASAAAINAVKANDRQAYETSYKAFKNLDLMFKRHQLMKDDYDAARELAADNQSAGAVAYKLAAAKFEDPIAAHLIDADEQEKLGELMDKRNHTSLEMEKLKPEIELAHATATLKFEGAAAAQAGDWSKVKKIQNQLDMLDYKTKTTPEELDPKKEFVRLKVLEKGATGVPVTSEDMANWGAEYEKTVKEAAGSGGLGSGIKARYDQNMVRSGSEVARTLGMLDQFPSGTSAGVFGGAGGETINSWFRGRMRDEDQTDFNSSFAGIDQEMGNLLRNGLGVSDSTAHEMVTGFKPVASDTNFNRVYKLANLAAKTRTAVNSTFPVDPEAKAARDELIQKLDIFPSPEEVRAARLSGKSITASTFGDALRQIKDAGKKAEPPPEAIEMLKKDPGTAPHFDDIFGPGAAEKILGK